MLKVQPYGPIPLEPAHTEARPIPLATPHASPDARRANDGASQYFVRVARHDAQPVLIHPLASFGRVDRTGKRCRFSSRQVVPGGKI